MKPYILALACTIGLFAQTGLPNLTAEMAVPFGTVPGQVVLHDDYLVFVDGQQPTSSFAILRTNIVGVKTDNGVTALSLTKPVRNSAGTYQTLNLRLIAPEGQSTFESWVRNGPTGSGPAATGMSASSLASSTVTPIMSFDAAQRRRFGGDIRGRLIVTNEKLIFDSVTDADRSRQWQLSDIKELKQNNAYNVRLTPFVGDTYEFQLIGNTMDATQFKQLGDMISRARLNK